MSSAFGSAALGAHVGIAAPSSTWNSWSEAQSTSSPRPFWDNKSSDGQDKTLEKLLPMNSLRYLGTSEGAAVQSFLLTSDQPVKVTLLGHNAGDAAKDEIGWYNPQNPNYRNLMFYGNAVAGSSVTISPGSDFGLWFDNTAIGATFDTQANLSTTDKTIQHFAAFSDTKGDCFIGVEDLSSKSHSDFDYNDVMIEISPSVIATPLPKPVLGGVVLFGLVGIMRLSRLRKACP